MVEAIPLRPADRANAQIRTDVQPANLQPANFQANGAEMNALRIKDMGGIPPSWTAAWEAQAVSEPELFKPGEGSQPRREVPHPQLSPQEEAAVQRNSAAVDKLFPGNDNADLRNAAYRYLMNREGQNGYPKLQDSDMDLLKKNGALDALDKLVEEDRKKGLITGPGTGNP